MSAISQQSWISPGEPLFIPIAGISSLTVANLIAKTVNTLTISTGFITADTISTNKLNVSSVELVQFIDAQYTSTVTAAIEVGTISTLFTNQISLDQATLNVANGNTLLLNGIPIATTQDLSTIQDWSIYPAYSTINFTEGKKYDIGSLSSPARVVYASTLASDSALLSTLATQEAFTSSIYASTGSFSTINISSINGNPLFSASNWYMYPAKGNVTFQPDQVNQPQYNLTGVSNIVANNITAQLAGFPTPIAGGQVTGANVTGGVGNFGTLNTTTTGTFSNNTKTTLVEIYGVNKPPGFNALYVNGGFTVDAGLAVHGITLGTNTAGVSLNRIDILPVGTQDYITWGAAAHVAGLGMTFDAGLGINIAAGLAVDVLAKDVTLRANDLISLDADDNINVKTNTLAESVQNYIVSVGDTYVSRSKNTTYNTSSFTVAASNINQLIAQKITQGTPLPPSTVGTYSTTVLNSIYEGIPGQARLAVQDLRGVYTTISAPIWTVSSNISTIYTPSTTGLLSSYTSSFTSSLVTIFSTIPDVQAFPIGVIEITPSSMFLQHNTLVEIDTKPFQAEISTPALNSTVNVSSLYSYQANADGFIKQEIGQVIQAITPIPSYFSTQLLSTGISSGIITSTLLSSIFSTLFLSTGFTSSIYNTSWVTATSLSTPAIQVSTLNGQRFPYPYGSFSVNSNQTIGVPNTAVSTIFDTTEIANGISIVGASSPQIAVSTSGIYRWLASPQFNTTSGGTNPVTFWFQKNGSNITRSASRATVANNNTLFSAVEIMESMNANDTLTFCFTSSDTNMNLAYLGPTGVVPAAPALILTGQKIAEK